MEDAGGGIMVGGKLRDEKERVEDSEEENIASDT